MNRRILVPLILAVIIIGGIGVWWFFSTPRSTDTKIVDRDTGEVFDKTVNTQSTGAPSDNQSSIKLFGIEDFIKTLSSKGHQTDFVDSVKESLWTYSNKRLNDSFPSLTLRPQNMIISKSLVTGEVRLGQTNEIIPIAIHISTNDSVAIVDINKGNSSHGGTFEYVGGINNPANLQFTITQTNDTSTDLSIQTYSNREAALQYIESLGYNVPDFSITFSNYENPFK